MISRALYRARQFAGALRPRREAAERAQAAGVLGEALIPLFDSMSLRDQRHCFGVYRTLAAQGCCDSHLLMAALLHDAGKGRLAGADIRLWHRVAYVVLGAGAPALLNRLAGGRGGPFAGPRAGLAALHHHGQRGAALAHGLGAPPAVVELIARHEDASPTDERLRLLRAADDA
ncbi:MAG: hypothetical protein Q7T33_01830 [Dehalococcoidia bacterium]|nr:hypothetical protein [Dehalococcoidia bacterium]